MFDSVIGWLSSPAFTTFDAPTSWAEVLGFVTGAICVYLVAKQHILNWPIGIANNLLWILLFFTAGLYADSALQVVYIALAVWGWYLWLHGGTGRRILPVSSFTTREWAGLAAAGVAGTVVMTLFLDHLTPSTVPFWDAVTTVLSLMATYGQAKKKWQSWLLWIAADAIYIPLYHHKGLSLTALLYLGFAALCVKGLIEWRRSMATPTQNVEVVEAAPQVASAR
jgi:nicotinamide mononucleotide transporter